MEATSSLLIELDKGAPMSRTHICPSAGLRSVLIALSLYCVEAGPQSLPRMSTRLNFPGEATDSSAQLVGGRPKTRFVAKSSPSGSVHLVARNTIAEDQPALTLIVTNNAETPAADLVKSEAQATRIFRESGIAIGWINCAPESAQQICSDPLRPNQFVVHIVSHGHTSTESIFGLSFLWPDGTGVYSNVFYDRIQQMHRNSGVDGPRLLGTVIAHEVGHLLLGLHAHSLTGIMRAEWSKEELRRIDMGCMEFTPEQSSRMKARIARFPNPRDLRDNGEFPSAT